MMENDRNLLKTIYPIPSRAAKRLFDILAAALGLILLSPVPSPPAPARAELRASLCLLSLLIKRDSPGPVFYRGPRMGLGGRVFHILKFRTMREEAASYAGPGITAHDDARITPLGAWLRDMPQWVI